MSFLELNTLQLISRNEGRIKSYDSCFDVRAWSHDIGTRNRYLKEWIRCDMPHAFVPLCAVTRVLRNMSCRGRGRVVPRCHVDCKSKVILDNICTSCHAMKQCLRNDQKFEKYFVEEELESSHWPCERCLEALKGIKMFWRVIIDKVFNINVSKTCGLKEKDNCCPTNSVRDVARMWQKDLVHEALLVKAINKEENRSCCTRPPSCRKRSSCVLNKMCSEGDRGCILTRKASKCTLNSSEYSKRCSKQGSSDFQKCDRKTRCRCTSVHVKTCDTGCNTTGRSECEEMKAYRTNLEYVKKCYNEQSIEVKKLRNENCLLKTDIQSMCNSCKWKSSLYRVDAKQANNKLALVPTPFEYGIETCQTSQSAKDAESEMIITMKNCKNENFKHVSLLQVLHKSNEPLPQETSLKAPGQKKEDPVELLNKVQTTLGAIFRREITLSANRKCENPSDIEATFHCLGPCRSQSCTTLSTKPQSQCFLN